MIKRFLLFFLILITAHAEAETTTLICERFKNISFPQIDRPSAATLKSREDCPRSVDLYYGISKVSNFEQARLCAFYEDGSGEVFTGRDILMMIYANGRGVKQNLDLAISLACEIDGPPGRVQHLLDMEKDEGKIFDFCDDVTSQDMHRWCGELKVETERGHGNQKIQSLFGKWDPDYLALKNAADEFFTYHAESEFHYRDPSSSYEMASHYKDFYTDVEKCANGTGPDLSHVDFKKNYRKLDRIYMGIQRKKIPEDLARGGISKGGIRGAQKAWIQYQDAWEKFGQKKCPNISVASWKAKLTESRVNMLLELSDE